MSFVGELIRFLVTYLLCLFYSVQVLFGIVVKFFTNSHSNLWVVKKRAYPPLCLQNHTFGEHKYITANGIKLHYVEKGDSSKPLMLLVHGFPEFWFSWRHQLNEFSRDYWVVALDQRGYGESEKPTDVSAYRIENLVTDLRELLRALGREKCTLVCHDWGSLVGWSYITQHMETIEKYIMMGAPSQKVARKLMLTSSTQFKMSWYIFFFQMPYLPELFIRLCDLQMFDVMFGKYEHDVVEAYKFQFYKKNALTYPINYYRANVNFFQEKRTVSPKMPDHFAPGLYLLGEHDLYISKATGPELQKQFKNLEYRIVEGADHFLQQDKPDEVNKIMREFLAIK